MQAATGPAQAELEVEVVRRDGTVEPVAAVPTVLPDAMRCPACSGGWLELPGARDGARVWCPYCGTSGRVEG